MLTFAWFTDHQEQPQYYEADSSTTNYTAATDGYQNNSQERDDALFLMKATNDLDLTHAEVVSFSSVADRNDNR